MRPEERRGRGEEYILKNVIKSNNKIITRIINKTMVHHSLYIIIFYIIYKCNYFIYICIDVFIVYKEDHI